MPEKAPLPITVASSGMQKYGQAHSASPNRVPHLSRCSTSASNAARSSLIEAMRQERLAHANFCRAAGVSSVAICETTSGGKSSSQDRRCHTLIPEELFALAMASIVRRFLAGGGDSAMPHPCGRGLFGVTSHLPVLTGVVGTIPYCNVHAQSSVNDIYRIVTDFSLLSLVPCMGRCRDESTRQSWAANEHIPY